MVKTNLIFLLAVMLLLPLICGGVSAVDFKIEYNASQMNVSCGGVWVNVSKVLDGNWATYSRASYDDAYCIFNVSRDPGLKNATWHVRSNGVVTGNISLPSSCLLGVGYSLKVLSASAVAHPNPGAYWYCLNTSGVLQLLFSNGGGTYPPDHSYIYEQSLEVTYDTENHCPGKPSFPTYAQDDFSYSNQIDNCYWDNNPIKNIYPTGGQMCYDATANPESLYYYLNGEGNMYSSDVFTEEFDLFIYQSDYIEKTFRFSPLGLSGYPTAHNIIFSATPSSSSLGYITLVNGTSTLESICNDCFITNESTHVKIAIYGPTATGYTALNSSSGMAQAIQPGTTAIQLNAGVVYFNLPNLQAPEGDYFLPRFAGFDVYDGYFCLDNYVLYSGVVNTPAFPVNDTGIPYAQVGEPCTKDSNCFTGLCNFLGICDRRGFKSACVNGYECQSGKCVGNQCTNPTLSQTLDQVKDQAVGDDAATNNIISFMISIGLALLLAGALFYFGAGALSLMAGGVVFVLSMFMLALMGWLSPFILIGLIIVLILLVFFGIIMRG